MYYGVGVLFTITVVVAVAAGVVPNVAVFLIPAYWVAGWLLSMFLFLVVLSRASIAPILCPARVVADPGSAGGDDMAYTCADALPWIAGAVGLVVLGLVLTVLRRRRA